MCLFNLQIQPSCILIQLLILDMSNLGVENTGIKKFHGIVVVCICGEMLGNRCAFHKLHIRNVFDVLAGNLEMICLQTFQMVCTSALPTFV